MTDTEENNIDIEVDDIPIEDIADDSGQGDDKNKKDDESKFEGENLMLLEFMVDDINLEYYVRQELELVPGETCISFQFFDIPSLIVREADFLPNRKNYSDGCGCGNFKNGMSCLFAMTPQQVEDCQKAFDIYVEVYREGKVDAGGPEKIFIGESLISIVKLFRVLKEAVETSKRGTVIHRNLRDCFKINNARSGELMGSVAVYITMTYYGKLIISEFQMNLDDKTVEFKVEESSFLFKTPRRKGDPKAKKSCGCRLND